MPPYARRKNGGQPCVYEETSTPGPCMLAPRPNRAIEVIGAYQLDVAPIGPKPCCYHAYRLRRILHPFLLVHPSPHSLSALPATHSTTLVR